MLSTTASETLAPCDMNADQARTVLTNLLTAAVAADQQFSKEMVARLALPVFKSA